MLSGGRARGEALESIEELLEAPEDALTNVLQSEAIRVNQIAETRPLACTLAALRCGHAD